MIFNLDVILYIITFAFMIWGVIATTRYYLSIGGRFEDYYFLSVIICLLGYFMGQGITLVTNKIDTNVVIFTTMQLTWAYWFLMMFSFKQNNFKSRSIKRIFYVLLTIFFVFGNTGFVANISGGLNQEILSSNMSLLMQSEYSLDKSFFLQNETIKIIMIIIGMIFSYRACMAFSWMFFGYGFLLTATLITIFNKIFLSSPCHLFYDIEQIFVVGVIIFFTLGINDYFKGRMRK